MTFATEEELINEEKAKSHKHKEKADTLVDQLAEAIVMYRSAKEYFPNTVAFCRSDIEVLINLGQESGGVDLMIAQITIMGCPLRFCVSTSLMPGQFLLGYMEEYSP